MKKVICSLLITSIIFLSSCLKENHSIRLKNNYPESINNVVAGTAKIGNVASGATSEYKPIDTGNFSISGTSSSGQTLSGSGSISGKGTHKWTMTLSSAGQISLVADK